MQNDQLLPCPFCGGPGEIYSATERKPDADGTLQGHWVADCSVCNVNIEFLQSAEQAVEIWNTRAAPDPIDGTNSVKRGGLKVTVCSSVPPGEVHLSVGDRTYVIKETADV